MFKDIHINKGSLTERLSVTCMIAVFFVGSMLLSSTFLSQGVFADSMSERMKIREEILGALSDDQNIMSTNAAEDDLSNGNCAYGACHIGHTDKPNLLSPQLSTFLGAKWWKWAVEIPTPINPLIDANPCNVNQHGHFFFLAGVILPADTSGHIERTCTIPKGEAIFFPVYTAFQTFGPQPPSGPPATVQEAIKIVKDNVNQATNLKASVDGTPINVNMLRSLTIPFGFTLPQNNIFGLTKPSDLGPYTAIADGYWVGLNPLSVGTHEISFSADHPSGNIDVTYHLKVQ
jgi:hypothetical protein